MCYAKRMRPRSASTKPFLVSLAIHVIIILGFVFFASLGWLVWTSDLTQDNTLSRRSPSATDASNDLAATGQRDTVDPEEPADVTSQQARDMIDDRLEQVRDMSPQQQMEKLEILKQPLSDIQTERVESIARLAEQGFGADESVRQRRYEPDPNAQGRFDPDTAVLYDIETLTDPDTGFVSYRFVYVDDMGRSLESTRPESQVSAADRRAAQVYAMARDNPQMRALIQTVNRIHAASEAASTDPSSSDQTE